MRKSGVAGSKFHSDHPRDEVDAEEDSARARASPPSTSRSRRRARSSPCGIPRSHFSFTRYMANASPAAVDLDEDVVLRARAVAPVLGVVDASVPARVRARQHAVALESRALEDRRKELARLLLRDEPGGAGRSGIVAEREAGLLGLHRRGRRRDPVAEAAVDDGLGRPEGGERLAALAEIVELRVA